MPRFVRTAPLAVALSVAFAAAALPALAQGTAAKAEGPLTEREQAIHVLSRLSFGARPGEIDQLARDGWKDWVERQLDPASIPNPEADRRVRGFDSLGKTPRQLMVDYNQQPKDQSQKERRRVNQLRQVPGRELQTATLLRAVYSERHFEEVICDFWRNHLNVDLNKDQVRYLATDYEREVIRKHAFGTFEELLLASAKHPAMLIYLDNVLSQKPLSAEEAKALAKAGAQKSQRLKRLARERGLNENYARELLELHTLGVDNVYKQRDVVELSRVLTGWTVERGGGGSWGFAFREALHDTGTKRVLRWRLKSSGVEEGEQVIRGLAKHKQTAQFICWKLLRYLVNDEPPEDYVDRVAKVFLKSKGDLTTVYRAIIFDEAFFDRAHYRAKFKTPLEYVVSMLRSVGADVKNPQVVLNGLQAMRHPIYRCEDPTGYYDTKEAWLDPGVLALRWQYALDLAETRTKAIEIPPRFFGRAPSSVALQHWLASQIVPAGVTMTTRAVLEKAMRTETTRAARQKRVTGLLLGCPEFQRQ